MFARLWSGPDRDSRDDEYRLKVVHYEFDLKLDAERGVDL
jgi:hypothetical protein